MYERVTLPPSTSVNHWVVTHLIIIITGELGEFHHHKEKLGSGFLPLMRNSLRLLKIYTPESRWESSSQVLQLSGVLNANSLITALLALDEAYFFGERGRIGRH